VKIKWLKLHRYIEDSFKCGLADLTEFECLNDEFDGYQYRSYVLKDVFDEGGHDLTTVILGIYDIESEFEYEPFIFQIPSTLINRLHCFVNREYS